jgi:hypothetical protein
MIRLSSSAKALLALCCVSIGFHSGGLALAEETPPADEPSIEAENTASDPATPENSELNGPIAQTQPAPPTPGPTAPAGVLERAPAPPPSTTTAAAPIAVRLKPRTADEGVVQRSFPLGVSVNLDNSVGAGSFLPGYYNRPSFVQTLSLSPYLRVPTFDDLIPKTQLSANINFSIGWLSSYQGNTGPYDRRVVVSDMSLSYSAPSVWTEEFTGIRVTPNIGLRIPLSMSSWLQNVVLGESASVRFGWAAPKTPIGTFTLGYSPGVSFTQYSAAAATVPCGTPLPDDVAPLAGLNVLRDSDSLPLLVARKEEYLPNGECVVAGRRSFFSVRNSFSANWALDSHMVSVSLGISHGFLEPLSNRPDLRGLNASGQTFGENTSGSIQYGFTVPVDFDLAFYAGISSGQNAWSSDGKTLRFPFLDIFGLGNNSTSASVGMSIGI